MSRLSNTNKVNTLLVLGTSIGTFETYGNAENGQRIFIGPKISREGRNLLNKKVRFFIGLTKLFMDLEHGKFIFYFNDSRSEELIITLDDIVDRLTNNITEDVREDKNFKAVFKSGSRVSNEDYEEDGE